MLNEQSIREICNRTLALSSAPATEVRLDTGRSALTRLAHNEVSESIGKDRASLSVRVLLGPANSPNKVGIASTNRLDDAGLKAVVAQATHAAELGHEEPTLLPPLGPQKYQSVDRFDAATAECSADRRTAPLRTILERCRREGLQCAGAFSTGAYGMGIATSAGLFAFHRLTKANCSLTVSQAEGAAASAPTSSGWSEQLEWQVDRIDPAGLAEQAFDIARRSRQPRPLPPGGYTVLLPPAAVGELLMYLAWGGWSTKAILEGRSFFSGKLGQQVFGPNISIADDAFFPRAGGFPFDQEGLPRQRVPMIEAGGFTNMVHGRETARLAKSQPTGHGLIAPTTDGAIPCNLVLAPGNATVPQMIGSVEHGLLVTHLHYVNILRPTDLTLTGMTRDGLFLIENGKVAGPANNMRFTQSLVTMLNNVIAVGSDLSPVPGFYGGQFLTPSLLVKDFQFSSSTEF